MHLLIGRHIFGWEVHLLVGRHTYWLGCISFRLVGRCICWLGDTPFGGKTHMLVDRWYILGWEAHILVGRHLLGCALVGRQLPEKTQNNYAKCKINLSHQCEYSVLDIILY